MNFKETNPNKNAEKNTEKNLEKKADYKNTIRLPQTDFPMKGNLPQKEPDIIDFWEKNKIYHKILEKNKGKKNFTLPDGPPYANGSIHIGHHLNKTLKDIIIKYKNMSGNYAPFIPGWDCHGLPIEQTVLKALGSKVNEKKPDEIRKLCRDEALKWVSHQKQQFRRLGVLADWENPYLTLDPSYEAEEVREFARAFKKGTIYWGRKPVYWNWTLKTALAEAEIEYHNHKSPSIYVKFNVSDPLTLSKIGSLEKKLSVVIWTTTPWTLPANLGICLNETFDYGIYDDGSEYLFIAIGLKENFEEQTGLKLKLVKKVKGSELEGGWARHPFMNRNSKIILGDHVSLDAGTGCVHTAPGHGSDDYKVGLKYGLEVLSPVDDGACFTEEVPEWKGLHIFKANPLIVEKLRESGHLIKFSEIEHSYPFCWRSKIPLIFRATPQWFLGLDQEDTKIREKTLKVLDKVKFFPAWGEARLRAMMENRPDWCLSRQRIWGVPIPIFYCKKTEQPLANFDLMMLVADTIEKEGGMDAYYSHTPEYFIDKVKGLKEEIASLAARSSSATGASTSAASSMEGFGSEGFVHGKDILDVWFDSGICHAAVQKRREGLSFPADIYIEGSDQHRGWFNTSLLSSMATNGEAPYKALVTHGFVTDSQGKKMSKSLGNVVDPIEVAKRNGIEILRLWAVYEDYAQDLTCGSYEIDRVTETYRRIRNTMRFLLGACNDFDPHKEMVPYEKMTIFDQWALSRLFDVTMKVKEAFEEYSFYKVYHILNTFFTVDLSATYLDILKDRLYTWKQDGLPRKSSQSVLFLMTDYLVRMMAPILSFLSEEIYSYMKESGKWEKTESVFLLEFPKAQEIWNNKVITEDFQELIKVRSDVQKELEILRTQKIIGSSLEAHVKIQSEGPSYLLLQKYAAFLKEFFIVSEVSFLPEGSYLVKAKKAQGEKCQRCWVYSVDTNKNQQYPDICSKCVEALS